MTTTPEPLVSVSGSGLHVVSATVAEKLSKKKLSPSAITGLEQCPARWLGESFVVRDIIEEQPDNPGRRGNLFHKVMEDFFTLPAEARTNQAIKGIVKQVSTEGEYADLGQIPEAVQWLKDAVNGYYAMGGKPGDVTVATVKDGDKERLGLEVFVTGSIGESKRDTLGFVDRVVVDPRKDDGSVVIEDWKSGAKAKRWNGKSTEGFAEVRQQVIYTELVEKMGMNVSGARLLYPVAQEVVNIPIGTKVRERVHADVEEADEKLDLMIDNNEFDFAPSFLCSWCPLARICPQADIKPYKKMQDALATQPTVEVLLKGFSPD